MSPNPDDAGALPEITVRPVPVLRQFWVVGGLNSHGLACFVGFFALIAWKLIADATTGGGPDGRANLPTALGWGLFAFAASFAAFWTLHFLAMVRNRALTTYRILPDRIEVARDGRPEPLRVIPLDAAEGVESAAGPFLRPHGLALLTVVVKRPSPRGGPPAFVRHPLPNVPDPDAVAEQIRRRIARLRTTAPPS